MCDERKVVLALAIVLVTGYTASVAVYISEARVYTCKRVHDNYGPNVSQIKPYSKRMWLRWLSDKIQG